MIDLELLHAYVDGELSSDERQFVESHLSNDAVAQAEVVRLRSLKSAVSRMAVAEPATPEWSRCVARLDEIDKARRVEGFVGKYAWGLCVLFFCAILAGGALKRGVSSKVHSGEVAAAAAGIGSGSWLRPPSKPDEKRDWVNESLGAATYAVQPDALQVLAVAKQWRDGHDLTFFRLADDRGELQLVVVSDAGDIDGFERMGSELEAGVINEMNCVSWAAGGYSMLLMAPGRSAAELAQIAATIRVQ